MKLSNILYTSAFTIALGAAAPLAIADNTGTYGAGNDATQEQMDQRDHDAQRDQGMGGHSDGQPSNPGAAGNEGAGTTGAGSATPDAPSHTPGGTNPEGAPDANRSAE
jgi:hypothetical protein